MNQHNTTRVDEERKCCIVLAVKIMARTAVGAGEKSLLSSDHGSELRLSWEREKEKYKVRRLGKYKKRSTYCIDDSIRASVANRL